VSFWRFVWDGVRDGYRQPFFWLCSAMIVLSLVFLALDQVGLTLLLLLLATITLIVDVRTGGKPK
jgi:hypothetical protein